MADLPPEFNSREGEGEDTGDGTDFAPTDSGTPRWVYVFGSIVLFLVFAFVVLHITGNGLGGHAP